jgi:cellulase
MKQFQNVALAALSASYVAAHATFQELWVDGVDMGSQCVRQPQSNSPVTNVASADIRCNVGGTKGVSGKCAVAPGSTVTVEMHQVSHVPIAAHGNHADATWWLATRRPSLQ